LAAAGIVCVIPGDRSGEEFNSACGAGGEDPVPVPVPVVVVVDALFLRDAVGEGALRIGEEEDMSSSLIMAQESYSMRAPTRPAIIYNLYAKGRPSETNAAGRRRVAGVCQSRCLALSAV
jgi:hypothetical protein